MSTKSHFIPNTHLDREWTLDFQHTRKMTVDFLDDLIEIMEKVPGYCFLLDAQAVPLEDYFEIRPENKAIIGKYIKEGRINAGPWYSALDMNCISGESILRNMLYGHRLVEEYGEVMKVGYTPFGWGQCSQFPQIYRGFGIDVCFFYRGITKEQAPGAEFAWKGVDGSKVLCSRFGTGARYNFYFGVWREALYEGLDHRLFRRMHWLEDAAPFKLCNSENRFSHGYVLPEDRKMNGELARQTYRKLIEDEKEHFTTEHIACMHGMDTSTPDLREKELLDLCQQDLEEGETFFLSSMPKYAQAIKDACPDLDALPTLEEEPRHVKMNDLGYSYIANDIISARTRQKVMLFDTENQLTRMAEPFAALASIHGQVFPQPYIDVAWKQVLKCHPHDTVGGCGIDRLEEDATYRMKDAQSVAQMVTSESLLSLQGQIDTSSFPEKAVVLTVYNPGTSVRTETVQAFVDVPREFINEFGPGEGLAEVDWKGFKLADDQGNVVAHDMAQTEYKNKVFRDHADLALMSYADEFKLTFVAGEVPALGYKTFVLTVDENAVDAEDVDINEFKMENEYLAVSVNENGTVDLLDKASGEQFAGLNYFEDSGEAGNPWTYVAPEKDLVVSSKGAQATRAWAEANGVRQSIVVEFELQIPQTTPRTTDRFDWRLTERKAENLQSFKVEVIYTLDVTAKSLAVTVRFDNQCTNHRLRAMFPTAVASDDSYAESPFDVVTRRIPKDDANPYKDVPHLTYPMLRFSGIASDTRNFTLISGGLKEYEVLEDDARTYALTLMRAYETNLCTAGDFDLEHKPSTLSQSAGEHELHYSIYVGARGEGLVNVFAEADSKSAPLVAAETKARKGTLPSTAGFLEIEDARVQLSGLTGEARGDRLVLRVFNPTDDTVVSPVKCNFALKSATLTNLNEENEEALAVSDSGFQIELAPRKIVSVALELA